VLVFVNYRTGDGEVAAALIGRELSRRFGSERVFRASTGISPGEDFERAILRAVRRSAVLLAVIGPRWLEARGQGGRRCIDDEADWTRREILEAFACDVTVVPVLLGGRPRLAPDDLPESLRPLTKCQYLRFDHRNDELDLTRIIDHLTGFLPGSDSGSNPIAGRTGVQPGPVAGRAMPPIRNTNTARDNAHVGQQNGINFGSYYADPRQTGESR
jgi:hypothetical protein